MDFKKIFLKSQKHIESLYDEYLEEWRKCARCFREGMDIYFASGISEEYAFWVEHTHKMESNADDLRRRIEFELYSKALLPESRGDILGLLEAIDNILNKLESVLFQILLEKIAIPDELKASFQRIVKMSVETNELMVAAASNVFRDLDEIIKIAKEIDQKESECDHAERNAIGKLYRSDLDGYTKISLKNLIIAVGDITDRAECVSDRLVIFSVKRRV
jgi:hypothetical protein